MRLDIGSPAPAFTLHSDSGSQVSLADFTGRTALLYFYPAAMTPGCTKQASDFRDNLGAFDSAGYAVIGISPDTPAKLASFRENDALSFTLLSDPDQWITPLGGWLQPWPIGAANFACKIGPPAPSAHGRHHHDLSPGPPRPGPAAPGAYRCSSCRR